IAVDTAGNLYLGGKSIQKRDAQGGWSIVATQSASALAIDAAGNVYAAEGYPDSRIKKRDAQGNWSVIATNGSAPGSIMDAAGNLALAVDAAGSLYVVDWPGPNFGWRIQKRDAQGNWSAITTMLGCGEA